MKLIKPSSPIFKMTIQLDRKMAYLIGIIIGDGHIANSTKSKSDKSQDYRIKIDISDKEHLHFISNLIKSIIKTKSVPKKSKIYGNRKARLYFQIRNKDLFMFLTKQMKIPNGAKSRRVYVPIAIKNANKIIQTFFLAGYFDADGGLRNGSLGFTTASCKMQEDISVLLDKFQITHAKEKWLNKNYDRYYFGIRIYKREIDKFLKTFPLQNQEKLKRIYKRFYAELPEWSNPIKGDLTG